MNNNQPLKQIILILFLILISWTAVYGSTAKRTTLRVDNLSCTSYLATIEERVMGLAGTLSITSDLDNGIITVDHLQTVTGEEIAAALSRLGYPARFFVTATIEKDIKPDRSEAGLAPATTPRFSFSNCNRRSCSATASAWKELYRRYLIKAFGK